MNHSVEEVVRSVIEADREGQIIYEAFYGYKTKEEAFKAYFARLILGNNAWVSVPMY